ncbi:hypothetical protein Taro_024141 [Colocasia esculenta]|uniref:SCP domain-containing protein n=1 Tax=Colocasia esculenta TaxID=4460 RepID=A0A843VGL7_COLES|nr:hypothetical protein [Colocasia esculenta]
MAIPSPLSLALGGIVVMISCMVHIAGAQNTPSDWVRLHNAARLTVGVPPVSWDNSVAAYASWYANQRRGDCQLVHSMGRYGENLYKGWGREFTAEDAMRSWVNERQYYNCGSNSCVPGKVCGHYTQVMWSSSTKIGCARVKCNNGQIFMTCNYSPPGNFNGQRPYPCPRIVMPGELPSSDV